MTITASGLSNGLIWQQNAERTGREIAQADRQSKGYCLFQGKRFGHGIIEVQYEKNGMAGMLIELNGSFT